MSAETFGDGNVLQDAEKGACGRSHRASRALPRTRQGAAAPWTRDFGEGYRECEGAASSANGDGKTGRQGQAGTSDSRQESGPLPIGVFDSGVGGLTVLSAIRRRLPDEELLYLGDTARLPYGTKSSAAIVRYALQATEKLVSRGIRLLVVACNTATAAALPSLREAYPRLPVIGVVEPGARAAARASRNGRIAVLATESTIRNDAYTRAIHALRPDAEIRGIPCSLFVALAEEGWTTGPVAEAIAARYLAPILADPPDQRPDCLVLGCTHFPPLAPAIRAVAGNEMVLVDSAATTAEAVAEALGLLEPGKTAARPTAGNAQRPGPRFLTTDAPERFARVGSLFLGAPITDEMVELVSL